MSIKAINWARAICADIGAPPKHRLVLLVICIHHNDKTGQCFPSYETIANSTGFRRRGVIDIVKELEDNGLLTKRMRRENGHQGSNSYVLFGRPTAAKWVSSRVQKKATCKSATTSTQGSVLTGAPDRNYTSKESGSEDRLANVLPFAVKTGGETDE